MKIKLLKILIAVWTICCLIGICRNCLKYSFWDWVIMIVVVSIPYIIMAIIYKKITSKNSVQSYPDVPVGVDVPTYIENKNTTYRTDGQPISDAEKPYLIESGKNQPKKNHGFLKGCLTVIIVLFVLCAGIGVILLLTMDKITNPKSEVRKYIDVTDEQATTIESVLNDCGIEHISSIEHDELLDNVHIDGETGYRLKTGNIDNIILYLSSDKTVNQVRYADYDLYTDGSNVATLQDYTISNDELTKYQYLCQEKVKEVLKSPSTAKFPNYTEWGFKQEKNIFTVQGYVDAQNSFGAEIRSKFQFVIDMDLDTIQSFIFDGQELIK